jgi:transcriptional regulator with XRE-family HTH domain
MAEEWTGHIVGLLHTYRITQAELAAELGVTAQYVSMVLNGKKSPKGIYERMKAAIQAITDRRISANAGA